VRKEFPGEKRA